MLEFNVYSGFALGKERSHFAPTRRRYRNGIYFVVYHEALDRMAQAKSLSVKRRLS